MVTHGGGTGREEKLLVKTSWMSLWSCIHRSQEDEPNISSTNVNRVSTVSALASDSVDLSRIAEQMVSYKPWVAWGKAKLFDSFGYVLSSVQNRWMDWLDWTGLLVRIHYGFWEVQLLGYIWTIVEKACY
jgi:hypothetical protein